MLKTCVMNDGNLREFGTGIYQTPIFFPCKGLLRLGRHNAFASLLVGVGTVGVVLAYKYGPAISHPFQWMGSCISSGAVNSTQSSPTEELTIPGLQNLSNNCFLNVVLQALATSHIFQSFVENCVQMSNTLLEENAEFMPLAVAVSALLEELCTLGQKRRVASPREVMLGLEGYVANFDLARQQDAAEALEHLLSSLKEECLVYIQQYMPHCGSLAGASVLSDHEFCNRIERGEHINLKTWNQYLHGPLDGTLGSLLTCQSCLFQFSTQFEFFHILPIPPILYSDGNIIEGCTIQDCLKQFTALEWITNYRCNLCSHLSAIQSLSLKTGANKATIQKIKDCNNDDKCSCEALLAEQGLPWPAVYRNAFKQLRIGRCPEVLCINLHRAAINETGELIKKRGHVYFPLVFDLFPYTVAAKEGNRELQENEMQMQMKQSWSMLSHMKDFEIQLERNSVPWRSNFVSQSSCYTASISENGCERNICGSAGQLFPPQDYKHPNDEMPALTETINCENSHSFLKLDAEENGIRNTFFGDQGEKFRDVYNGSEGMPTSFSKNPDGNQSCGCSQFETLQNQISDMQPISNQSSKGHTYGMDKGGCIGSQRNLPYGLISVVQHHGNSGSGHYTVYRKVRVTKELTEESSLCTMSKMGYSQIAAFMDQDEKMNSKKDVYPRMGDKILPKSNCETIWFRISDSDVERVTEKCVLEAEASLLFYERLEDAE